MAHVGVLEEAETSAHLLAAVLGVRHLQQRHENKSPHSDYVRDYTQCTSLMEVLHNGNMLDIELHSFAIELVRARHREQAKN